MKSPTFRTLFQHAWEIYTTHFNLFLAIGICFFLPMQLFLAYFFPSEQIGSMLEQLDTLTQEQMFELLGLFAELVVLGSTVGLLAVLCVFTGMKRILHDHKPVPFVTMLKDAKPFVLPLLGTSLLTVLLLIPLFILLVIPGIVFAIYWTFAEAAVIFSGKKYMDALRHSKALVKGRWWEVFVRLAALAFVLDVIEWLFFRLVPEQMVQMPWITAAMNTVLAILSLFVLVFMAVYYHALEVEAKAEHAQKAS